MKKNLILPIISYIISIILMSLYIFVDLKPNIYLSTFGRLILLCGTCLFIYLGGLFLSKYKKNNKPMKISLWIFFILYLLLFITLTLLDPMLGRIRGGFVNNLEIIKQYISNSFNIIPFKTIIEYIMQFNSLYPTNNIVMNLLGNFVCLMPFGFFLPLLFKKQNNFKQFFITSVVFILGIELTQFITLSGSCDIDDVILNVSGACLIYKILKTKNLNNLIKNIFLLEHNKLNLYSLLKQFAIFCAILILTFGLIIYRNKLYYKNLDKYLEKYNYEIKIIDDTEVCSSALEKFYETQLYEYYFSCIKSDSVYALINGEKYLVKDLLNNNPTDYEITIDKLEQAGLQFLIEEKYKSIALKEKGSVGFNPRIDDKSIIDVSFGNMEIDDYTTTKLYIIPKKAGKTTLYIEQIDLPTDNKFSTKKYVITVNPDLTVTYEQIK